MSDVHVPLTLINAFDDYNFRRGKLRKNRIRSATVQASVDMNSAWSTIPVSLAKELGVETTVGKSHALIFEMLGRTSSENALIEGDCLSIGFTTLNKLDLRIDSKRKRVIPNPEHPFGAVFRV